MKDQFDLKKFLTENKTIENSNPYLKEEKEISKKEEKDLKKISKQLKKSVKAHGVQAKTIDKALKEESKDIKAKIREMIINELSEEMDPEDEESPEMDADEALSQQMDADEYETYADAFSSMPFEESLDEAKEDEEEEIETDESEDTEEIEDEAPEEETEEEPETGGGLEDIAADMEGDEGDLMDHLISALKVSKAMDNEKLTTQIGNTLKFFVGEYIGGEE